MQAHTSLLCDSTLAQSQPAVILLICLVILIHTPIVFVIDLGHVHKFGHVDHNRICLKIAIFILTHPILAVLLKPHQALDISRTSHRRHVWFWAAGRGREGAGARRRRRQDKTGRRGRVLVFCISIFHEGLETEVKSVCLISLSKKDEFEL